MANIQDSILQAVDTLVANRISQIATDKTVTATIAGCNNALTREYYVTYNGGKMKAYAQEGASFSVGQSVYVLVPEGDFSNEKTIISVVQAGSDDNNISFVSSALSNYNLIGRNCLTDKKNFIGNMGLGLCSYKKEDYQVLYQRDPDPKIYGENPTFLSLDITQLENNLKEAEAILIEASFRTSLPRAHRVTQSGIYGLIFTLAFKDGDATDDNGNPQVKYLDYVIDSNSMTGSPFNYSVFFDQYQIFPIDLENFLYIENILFYSKDFVTETDNVTIQSIESTGLSANNIFIKDVEFYGLKTISATSGDYIMKLSATEGTTFYTTTALEKLSIIATLTNQNTYLTDDAMFYWFKEDSRVTSSSSDYQMYGGTGWSYLKGKGNSYTLNIYGSENKSYENKYLCVCVYKEEVILKDCVTFYNESVKRDITIESNLGNRFSFDRGEPTLTCLVNGKASGFEEGETNAHQDDWYRFVWSKTDAYGQVTSFQETAEELQAEYDKKINSGEFSYSELSALKNRITALGAASWNKNQLTYAVKAVDGSATFKCAVYLKDTTTSDEYLAGTAEITLTNEDAVSAADYYILIENGNQVFQYTESGVSPDSDRFTDPLTVKPLICHFYDPAGIEVNSKTYTVKWKVPIEHTLITTPTQGMTFNEASGKLEYCTLVQFPLAIEDDYDYQAQNNQVRAIVTYNGQEFWQDTDLLFTKIGENGTNGTDIVAKIVPTSTKLKDEALAVLVNADGESGKRTVSKICKFNSGQSLSDEVLSFELYNRNVLIDSDDLSDVQWTISGGATKLSKRLSCSSAVVSWEYDKDASDFTDDGQAKVGETWQTAEQKSNQYNYDIKTKKYRNQIIRGNGKYTLNDKTYDYYAFYPLNTIEYKYSQTYFKEAYGVDVYLPKSENLASVTYNADGRNPLYDKNKGISLGFKSTRLSDTALLERTQSYWYEWIAEGGEPDSVKQKVPTSNRVVEKDVKQEVPNKLIGLKTTYYVGELPDDLDSVSWNGNISERFWAEEGVSLWARTVATYADGSVVDNAPIEVKNESSTFDGSSLAKVSGTIVLSFNMMYATGGNSAAPETGWSVNIPDWETTEKTIWQRGAMVLTNSAKKITLTVYTDASALSAPPLTYEDAKKTVDETQYTTYTVYDENPQRAAFELYEDKTLKTSLENGKRTQGLTQVWIKPNDVYTGEHANNLVHCRIYDSEDAKNQLVDIYVPIYFSLNTYGLKSLNSWDGNHIEINEDDNYILAPQIGAGEKDDENKFTGIVMGTAQSYDQDEASVGLLGYSHGKQSIYLDAETGNAIFGLPEQQASQANAFEEGRIALCPGHESYIGAWRIGSKALYNMKDVTTGDSTVGKPYTDYPVKDADFSIPNNSQGMILGANPAYLSIKGMPLDSTNCNIEWGNANTNLVEGDSLEVEIDPTKSSTFSIYRHTDWDKDKQEHTLTWRRTPLVGINQNGQFYTNAVEDGESSMGIGKIGAFGLTAAKERYVGAQFGWKGTNLFKFFVDQEETETIEHEITQPKIDENGNVVYDESGNPVTEKITTYEQKEIPNAEKKLYLSMGTTINTEYPRPIGIYGKEVSLHAEPNPANYDESTKHGAVSTESDGKIFISADSAFIGHEGVSFLKMPYAHGWMDEEETQRYGSELYLQNQLDITAESVGIRAAGDGSTNTKLGYLSITSAQELSLKSINNSVKIEANYDYEMRSQRYQSNTNHNNDNIWYIGTLKEVTTTNEDNLSVTTYEPDSKSYLSLNYNTGKTNLAGKSVNISGTTNGVRINTVGYLSDGGSNSGGFMVSAKVSSVEEKDACYFNLIPGDVSGSSFNISGGGCIINGKQTSVNGKISSRLQVTPGISTNWGYFAGGKSNDLPGVPNTTNMSILAVGDVKSNQGWFYGENFAFNSSKGIDNTDPYGNWGSKKDETSLIEHLRRIYALIATLKGQVDTFKTVYNNHSHNNSFSITGGGITVKKSSGKLISNWDTLGSNSIIGRTAAINEKTYEVKKAAGFTPIIAISGSTSDFVTSVTPSSVSLNGAIGSVTKKA
jgi:hypothetical protein